MPAEQPPEQNLELIKAFGGVARDIWLTSFIKGVASMKGVDGGSKRMEIWGLIPQLQCNVFNDPPYNKKVADQIREWLKDDLHAERFNLRSDFESLLFTTEQEAKTVKKHVAQVKEAQAEEERKKERDTIENEEAVEEWNMIEKEEAEEEWQLI